MKKLAGFMIAMFVLTTGIIIKNNIEENTIGDVAIIQDFDLPKGLTAATQEKLAANKFVKVKITGVTDGDTIKVEYKQKEENVRLLDVDTPETVKVGTNIQEYGKNATEYTQKKALKKKATLYFEKSLRDKYGRLLAHVVLEDDTYLNGALVRNGLARAEVLSPNDKYHSFFNNLQERAIKEKKGLWALPEDKIPFIKDKSGKYVPRYWNNNKSS